MRLDVDRERLVETMRERAAIGARGFRDPSDEVVGEAYQRMLAEAAAEREGVGWEHEERMRAPSVEFADQCVEAVAGAAEDAGYDSSSRIL